MANFILFLCMLAFYLQIFNRVIYIAMCCMYIYTYIIYMCVYIQTHILYPDIHLYT